MQRTERETSAATNPTEGMAAFPEDRPAEPTAESIARAREGTPEKLKRRLQGDLDNILMTALSKEPQRRYASVEALSDDIRHYLEGLPVLARKPTLGYRAGKFARRHRLAVAASVALVALLVAFVAAMAVQSTRVARERDLAQKERAAALRERETAQRVSGFLVDLFKVSDPSEARGNSITAREVLDKGAARIATELKDQPEVRATMMDTMGNVYRNLGLYDNAIPLLQEALETRKAVLGTQHLDLARSLHHLAMVLAERGDHARAEALNREALAMLRKLLGSEHPAVAGSLASLAKTLCRQQKPAEAEPLARDALAIVNKALPGGHPYIAEAESVLGACLTLSRDFVEAETLLLGSYTVLEAKGGGRGPETREALQRIVRLYEAWGKPDKAGEYRAELAARDPDATR